MSSYNQPDVEDIVAAFKSTQNQSWSKFSEKLGGIPIKDCKKKDIFKSENPIELLDEDIPVFGLIPRVEKFTLVSCNKCSMIVKSDCIQYHYKHRHSNPEKDLFSVAQFIVPNVKTNKHKRPKLNVRKLPEKKIIDGDPIVQEIKSEFDQAEYERISKLNQATEQQENIIQYDGEATSVNLALICTPGKSCYDEFCNQSFVQYPNQNEVNDQITDYDEDLTKSVDLIKELQNNKCIDDTEDTFNENIAHCITKVEFNEKRKRKIEYTDFINDNEELYENNHPKKKYHHFPFKQESWENSSLKTSISCSDVTKNQNSDSVFTSCDQKVSDEITECDKNLNTILGNGKDLQNFDNLVDLIDRNTINFSTKTTSSCSGITNDLSFDTIKKRTHGLILTDVFYNSENKSNYLSTKPYVTSITSNRYSDVMKNQNVDKFVPFHDHIVNSMKETDCDKNLDELLDSELKLKSNKYFNSIVDHKIKNHEINSEISIKQINPNRKRKCSTDSSDFMNDNKEYYKSNQDSSDKYCNSPLLSSTYIKSNTSSVMSYKSSDYVASCDAKVNDKITENNEDSDVIFNDENELQNIRCVNDNINEPLVHYLSVFSKPLHKLTFNMNNKRKQKQKYCYLPFESSNFTSTIQYEENEYKMDETNDNSKIVFVPIRSKSSNDKKLGAFIPISKFIKDVDSSDDDSVSSFDKPSNIEHEKIEDQMDKCIPPRKNINLLLDSRSLDGVKLQKYNPINKCLKAIDDQCSSDSISSAHKLPTVKNEEVEDKMNNINPKYQIIYYPSSPRLKNNKECVPIGKFGKSTEGQCFNNSVQSFHKSLPVENEEIKDEMAKINVNSNIIYIPLPSSSLIDDNPNKYFSISEFVKAMDDDQYTSDTVANIHKLKFVKHEQVEDKIEKMNVNPKNMWLSSPPRSLNGKYSRPYLPIGKFVKTTEDQNSNDSVTSFHKPSSVEHKDIENNIEKISTNSNIIYFQLPPKSLNDEKQNKYIPISRTIKAIDDKDSSDSVTSFHNFSYFKHEHIKDKMDKIIENSNTIYFPLPPRLLNDNEPKKYVPISKIIETTEDQHSNDSVTSFNQPSSNEHENVKDKMDNINEDSNTIYFPLPPISLHDYKPKKYVPISALFKVKEDQHSNDSVTSFHHKPSSFEPKEIEIKKDKLKVNILKPRKHILIGRFVKTTDEERSKDSVRIFHKFSTGSYLKKNIQISSNDMCPDNINDGDENDKSKIQLNQVPSILMNSNEKIKYLSSNDHSKHLNNQDSKIFTNNIEEESKFAQNKIKVIKKDKNPDDADICYDNSSTALLGFKNKSKSSPINDFVVKEEYCCNGSYKAHYQGPNDYTLSQVSKPLSSVVKYSDSDIDTSSSKEQDSKTLNNKRCSSPEIQSIQKKIKLKSIDVDSNIINNSSYDETFIRSCQSSTSSLVKKGSRPLKLTDNLNAMNDNTLKNDNQSLSELLDNLEETKFSLNNHSDVMYDSSDSSVSSYDQSSVSSVDIKKRPKISLKDIFSNFMSDENSNDVTRLQDNLMKNNKCTQTYGCFNHVNCQQFIDPNDPIIRADKSIAESHSTNDDKTKCSQTDLFFGCMGNNISTKYLIDNYAPINSSNNGSVENLISSYTSEISSIPNAECTVNSFTSISSNAKSTNNSIAPTSIEDFESIDNHNSDHYISKSLHYLLRFQHTLLNPESHNDHFADSLTHHLDSDKNRQIESNDKTYSSYTDRAIQNEYNLNHNKITEPTSDVDKYFQSYKDRLKKITDEKLINGKNWKIPLYEGKMRRKYTKKRRLEAKVVDDKENYGLWDLTDEESLGHNRTFDFIMRPALRLSHFSDESD